MLETVTDFVRPAAAQIVGPAEFRSLMATFPTGVAVVTASEPDGRPWGMTCSSLCSVAVRPPTLLICLRTGSPTLAAALRRSAFAVNLLHDRARAVAELFASGAPDRFDHVRWTREPAFGSPHLVADTHTIADCRITTTMNAGDHVVVFGEVFRVNRPESTPPNPLLYGMRKYWSLRPRHDTDGAREIDQR
jgi:flavin reductase (DIM6/NTAB) family NADH-FMN oxidoreductase RutF